MAAGLSRRGLLQVGAAVGGGLLARVWISEVGAQAKAPFRPNAWLRIDAERTVFYCASAEMGQGVMTSLTTLLCEELDYDPAKIRVEFAPADRAFDNPAMGVQATGGSTSVKSSWQPLREAGATAREMLKVAAARRWRVPLGELTTGDGQVRHPSGKVSSYEALAESAAGVKVQKPALKAPAQFKYVGRSVPRLDLGAKVEGSAVFGIDVQLPGLKVAVVVRSPVIGGKVKSVDDRAAKAMPGVEDVVPLGYGVGVVGETYWHARQGAEKLVISWEEGKLASLSSEQIRARQKEAIAARPGRKAKSVGAAKEAIAASAKKVEAVYEAPYLAHAPMEPMNCTARVTDGLCEIWAPSQSAAIARDVGVELTGLSHDQVLVHTTFLGGGFGRRVGFDFVSDAVRLSKAVKKPVKVVWSREDDLRHGQFRPVSYHALCAGLDAKGEITGLVHQLATPSILGQWTTRFVRPALPNGMPSPLKSLASYAAGGVVQGIIDPTAVEGAVSTDYALPNHRVEWYDHDPGVPLAFWRSVGHSFNAFVMESFVDELAHAAGKDPLEARRSLLKLKHRNRWVLELVAEKAGWKTPPPKGVFRGLAQHKSFDSYAAAVAEVSVVEGEIKVQRVVIAIDCGRVVNPDLVAAQLEGSVSWGLSAALKGRISLDKGQVEQSNFHDYPVLRMNECPKIETYVVQNQAAPTGVGEPGVPVIAPAVANAVFAATGKRLRTLPLSLDEA